MAYFERERERKKLEEVAGVVILRPSGSMVRK
jgi:hypothetical protein